MKRMTCGVVGLVSLVGFVSVAGVAQAQSLADLARQEQARRKSIKQPTKVITNDDVRDVNPISTMGQSKEEPKAQGQEGAVAPTGEAAGTPGSDGPQSPTPATGVAPTHSGPAAAPGHTAGAPAAPATGPRAGAVGGGDEAQWRARAGSAREQLSRARIQLDAMRTRTAQLSLGASSPQEVGQVSRLRQDAQQEMARLQTDVQRYERALTDLEDEARRAGVPAGWLR